MNKFKKFLLGALSVLTLGLFTVTGAKVNATSTQPYVNLSLISGQTYTVGSTSQSTIATSDDGTTITSNFKTSETFANGYFTTTASSSNMVCDGNGLKYQKTDCSMTFSTADYTKVTIVLYDSDASRSMSVTNTNNLNVAVTGKGFSADTTEVTTTVSSSEYKYNYNAVASGNLISVTVNNCPATDFTISCGASKAVYIQSIKIQPYATVTYHTNGGNSVASTTALYGETFAPVTPTYDGYAFMGWYTDESLETPYNTSALVSGDLDLYADWISESSINKYTVSFYKSAEATTENLIASVEEVVEGTTVNVSLINANPEFGKEFVEWRLISDDSVFDSTTVVNSDLAVYAVYSNFLISDANSLSPDLITYTFNYGYTSSHKFSETTALTPSNYSALNGTYIDEKTAYSNINGSKPSKCFHTGGAYSSANNANGLEITFSQDVMLKIYCASTDSKNPADFIMYDKNAGSNYINLEDGIAKSGSQTELKVYVPAGTYQIGSDRAIRIWAIEKVDMKTDVTATTAAWQNSTKDSLRFVGTISGVTDLASIDTIELVLLKDDVATKKQIFLTTCFISVTGVGSYTEIDNTYYVVYRITGIDSTSMPDNTVIKHKLIVTFTDGSSVTSNLESSIWTN